MAFAFWLIFVLLYVLDIPLRVYFIGRPREPLTNGTALGVIFIDMLLLFGLFSYLKP